MTRLTVPAYNKYSARKTERDGILFDSRKEADHYTLLSLRQAAGEIADLRWQVTFDCVVNGRRVCRYLADFAYVENGKEVIVDVKSGPTRTPVYRLKKKLVEALYGITIEEV